MKKQKWISILTILILLSGCGKSKQSTVSGEAPAGKPVPDNSSTSPQGKIAILDVNGDRIRLRHPDGKENEINARQVDYALVGPVIIDAYCVKCHQGEKAMGGATLDGYENASRFAARILARIKPGGGMPPSGPSATAAEAKVIEFWIDNKTPEKGSVN